MSAEKLKYIFGWRALFAVALLASLCVSDNVGPRFLPIAGVLDDSAVIYPENPDINASRIPGANNSFRVPITVQWQKQSDGKHLRPLTGILPNGFVLPETSLFAVRLTVSSFIFASPTLSRPSGRAPPAV
jgi:hypothetical protein